MKRVVLLTACVGACSARAIGERIQYDTTSAQSDAPSRFSLSSDFFTTPSSLHTPGLSTDNSLVSPTHSTIRSTGRWWPGPCGGILANESGSSLTLEFNGTAITLYTNGGSYKVSLDDREVVVLPDSPEREDCTPDASFTVDNLSPSVHRMVISSISNFELVGLRLAPVGSGVPSGHPPDPQSVPLPPPTSSRPPSSPSHHGQSANHLTSPVVFFDYSTADLPLVGFAALVLMAAYQSRRRHLQRIDRGKDMDAK